MSLRNLTWRSGLAALIVLGAVAGVNASTFYYEDDFETNKAEVDSYDHSPFVPTRPDFHLTGQLSWYFL